MTSEELNGYPAEPEYAIEGLRGGERIHKLKRRLLSADGSEVHVLISARAIEGRRAGVRHLHLHRHQRPRDREARPIRYSAAAE
jgi:hypothetical protein